MIKKYTDLRVRSLVDATFVDKWDLHGRLLGSYSPASNNNKNEGILSNATTKTILDHGNTSLAVRPYY